MSRARSMARARDEGSLFEVKTPGVAGGYLCFPGCETREEAAFCAAHFLRVWNRPVPATLETWRSDGKIGATLIWDCEDTPIPETMPGIDFTC
jgi:hypothetical protein